MEKARHIPLLCGCHVQLFNPIVKYVTTMTTTLVEVFLLLVLILGVTTTVADNYRCFCFHALGREVYTSLEWGFLKIILVKRQVQEYPEYIRHNTDLGSDPGFAIY